MIIDSYTYILTKLITDINNILSFSIFSTTKKLLRNKKKIASAGNRTRAARVAGEHSTTEPPMLLRNIATGIEGFEKKSLMMLLFR